MHFNRVQICKKQQVCATFPRFSLETFFKLALTASVCHAMAMSWHSGAWPGLRCCLQGYTRRCTSLSREIQAHHYFHLVQALLACVHFFRIACKYLVIHWTPNLVGPTWFIWLLTKTPLQITICYAQEISHIWDQNPTTSMFDYFHLRLADGDVKATYYPAEVWCSISPGSALCKLVDPLKGIGHRLQVCHGGSHLRFCKTIKTVSVCRKIWLSVWRRYHKYDLCEIFFAHKASLFKTIYRYCEKINFSFELNSPLLRSSQKLPVWPWTHLETTR